jgi:UDP-N-acetylglucosamine--N-acetylmuramyl-(pentapeptide) pyrophosphoryl-undecaprenol N-acetylglucosamine transferase
MLKVLIATGGTGGHLFPAQQLAALLENAPENAQVRFAGHGLRTSSFFNREIPFDEIASSGSLKKWPALLKGFWQSLQLIYRFKPDVVVGFGSFHSFPVLLAAIILGKKIVLFEANCSLGKVNRFFAPFAKKVAFQFPISHSNAVYVPLLPWAKKKEVAKAVYGHDQFTILVFGGSQGAAFINQTFCKAAKLLKFPFQVIHFTGQESLSIQYDVPAVVKPFEENMAAAYEAADLVVCRCGAGTTAELIRFNKPSVVIPYPYAHDHQRKNGEFLKEGTRLLLQKEATPERLAYEIEKAREELELQKQALKKLKLPETVDFGTVVRMVGEKK